MPTSAMAATAPRLRMAGSEPPEKTSTRSPARWRSHPAAIWDRPALCTQRKSTAGVRTSIGIDYAPAPVDKSCSGIHAPVSAFD